VRYFEDFAAGQTFDLGTHAVSADEIVEFARRYDPQPFHVDADAAAASPFGGLIASGWLTAAICMRLYVDVVLADAASHGSPGMSQLRWLVPVRPGDVLAGRLDVGGVSPSSSRPERGTVQLELSLTNQGGEVVLSMRGRGLFGRRPT